MSTINLLPKEYLRRRAHRRANVLFLILFAIVMAGVIGAETASQRKVQHTLEVRDHVDTAYTAAARLIKQLQQLQSQRQTMLRKAELTASLLERVPRSYLLAMIANALPENTSLVEFELETLHETAKFEKTSRDAKGTKRKGSKLTTTPRKDLHKPPPTTVIMKVTGLAGTDVEVARLIANLARNPLIASVDLVYSEEKLIGKIPVRKFQLKLELKPNADVLGVVRAGGIAESQTLTETNTGGPS